MPLHRTGLTELSVNNLRADGKGDALDCKEIQVILGDGRKGSCALNDSSAA
jgi:hypothetical protein